MSISKINTWAYAGLFLALWLLLAILAVALAYFNELTFLKGASQNGIAMVVTFVLVTMTHFVFYFKNKRPMSLKERRRVAWQAALVTYIPLLVLAILVVAYSAKPTSAPLIVLLLVFLALANWLAIYFFFWLSKPFVGFYAKAKERQQMDLNNTH